MLANSKIADLEVKYEYESREKISMENQLADSQRRCVNARDELLKAEQKLIEQRMNVEITKKEVSEKEDFIDQLKSSKAYLEEQVEAMRTTLSVSREDCERLKFEQSRLQEEILNLKSSGSEVEARVQKIALERDRVQQECHSFMSKIVNLEQQIADLMREKEVLVTQVEDWKHAANR